MTAVGVQVVYVTVPLERAQEIARALVDRRVCACVNVLPAVRSFYRWKGAVEDDTEALLVIKTSVEGFEPLRAAVVELHPYEVPEVLAVPVTNGHAPYLDWVRGEVEKP